MHKLLATSAATRPTGSPPQRKLFRISEGPFSGRLAALYMDSASGISLVYSDYPHESWSSPQQIVTDSFDSPFGAGMDESNNIYLVYTDSSKDIKFLKLAFAAGGWTPGSAVTVLDVDDNYNPFIMKDGDGNLWCFIVNYRTSVDSKYYVRSKFSSDEGQTWGAGGGDLGTQISSGSDDICYVSAAQISSLLYAIYADGRSDLKYSVYDLKQQIWGSEITIHTANYIDHNYDIAVSTDKKLGVVFAVSAVNKVYFKEFDGSSWTGLYEVEAAESRSPQIIYRDNAACVFFAKHLGNGYYTLRNGRKSGDSFTITDYSPAVGIFDTVFVYDNSAGTQFEDKTAEAADVSSGDIFHSQSSSMLEAADDCLYLGKEGKFFCAAIILSTPGVGGQVAWEYYDGSDWTAFTPDSGIYHLDSADKLVYLWTDGLSAPADWEMSAVNGVSAYWIRIRVTLGFSTNPVGSQIIPAPNADDLVIARDGTSDRGTS